MYELGGRAPDCFAAPVPPSAQPGGVRRCGDNLSGSVSGWFIQKIASLSLPDWTRLAAFFVDIVPISHQNLNFGRLIIVPPFFLKAPMLLSNRRGIYNEVGELASGTGASGLADVLKPSNSVGIAAHCSGGTAPQFTQYASRLHAMHDQGTAPGPHAASGAINSVAKCNL